jgi:UDP-2,3-diacylglucosamine pyrophosphatase LpxH
MLRKARKGTRIIYLRGNHDDFLTQFIGEHFGGIEIAEEALHVTASGLRLLVLHGDQFDSITKYHKWLALLGDVSYGLLLHVNYWLAHLRKLFGYGHWSLSAYVKNQVKQAVNFIHDYETTIAEECRHRGFDGIVCGHIHHAEIKQIDDVLYINAGDLVEGCTAVIEDYHGNIAVLQLNNRSRASHVYHEGQILTGDDSHRWFMRFEGTS